MYQTGFLGDMRAGLRRIICLLVLVGYIFLPCGAVAQEATLSNVIVTNTRDDLLVYLNVEGAFREKMKKAILSGVPTTFSFFILLNRVRNFWVDQEIAELDINPLLVHPKGEGVTVVDCRMILKIPKLG